MKIYTKTGDKGQTSLISGKRLSKAHPRIDAYGTVDETNVIVGMLREQKEHAQRAGFLLQIQDRLFVIGSLLASDPEKPFPGLPELQETDITSLETAMDDMDAELPPMQNFVLPGGHPAVSYCHLARVVCRRAERLCIGLAQDENVEEKVIRYLNRLSDYFFVLSRFTAHELGVEEIPWRPRG